MTPAFGLLEAKALFPYFTQCSNSVSQCANHLETDFERLSVQQLADKWHEATTNGESVILDVSSWLCKATLDAYVREFKDQVYCAH